MQDLHEVLADQMDEEFYPSVSYTQLVKSIGVEILNEAEFGDYQGDIIFTVRDRRKHGILVCGFGSCSGCDAIQSITEYDRLDEKKIGDLTALRDQLAGSIYWGEENGSGLETRIQSAKDENGAYWFWNDGEEEHVFAEARKCDAGEYA
jgi:hypothetical protein